MSSPTLIAWSTLLSNKIETVELEKKQAFSNFDGPKLNQKDEYSNWSHVKEIANTKLLVSVHHNWGLSAHLEVFDISRKGDARKLYSFEEVSGLTGFGDVTFNPRRSILGAIPVGNRITYHLYSFDNSKAGNIVQLIRKSRWHRHYSTQPLHGDNVITGLDFDPNGETVATIDYYGTCLISNVNTDNESFHMNMAVQYNVDLFGCCRWSTNPDEPLLFGSYNGNQLNILDSEKKTFTMMTPIQLDANGTRWIDVCQNNGNLLAAGGEDCRVQIFDKRELRVVQTFPEVHENWINCVRWSPSGDMIATASCDFTATVLDFKTGKRLYTGESSDGKEVMSVCVI